jgi:LacI family transcriptional regulator
MAATPTIAEIARLAGVGTATVDRVLNKRPGVNPETARRVMEIVESFGAVPTRGRPRKNPPEFRFAFVLPDTRLPFLDLIDRQIAQLAGDFRHGHITEMTHRFPAQDPVEFARHLSQLGEAGEIDGIALLAPDVPPVKLAVNELVRSGVHVVTVFSDVGGSLRETLVSADNRAAGRVAGLLLGRSAGPQERAATVVLVSNTTRYSSEIERGVGFVHVVEEKFPGLEIVRLDDLPPELDGAQAAFAAFLQARGDRGRILGVYNVGAGTAGIAQALAAAGLKPPPQVVAHDLTDTNRALLASEALTYLLHQDTRFVVSSAARVLRGLCEGVRGALQVAPPRIEVLTSENLY